MTLKDSHKAIILPNLSRWTVCTKFDNAVWFIYHMQQLQLTGRSSWTKSIGFSWGLIKLWNADIMGT